MLLQRLVIGFPPIERLVAEKTNDVVGATGKRFEEEASPGKLRGASVGAVAPPWGQNTHIDRRKGLVWPLHNFWGARARVGRSTFGDDLRTLE